MHIKFPLISTVTKAYTDYGVGNYLKQQTREMLAMFDSYQNRNINVTETVLAIRGFIHDNMVISWAAATRRSRRCLDLAHRTIDDTVGNKIAQCWMERDAWVIKNKAMLSDLRSQVMGEDREDFVYTDQEVFPGEDEYGLGMEDVDNE